MTEQEAIDFAQLRLALQKAQALLWGAKCIYCEQVLFQDIPNKDITVEALKAHIEECPAHPLPKVRLALQEAQKEIKLLEGIARAADEACEAAQREQLKLQVALQESQQRIQIGENAMRMCDQQQAVIQALAEALNAVHKWRYSSDAPDILFGDGVSMMKLVRAALKAAAPWLRKDRIDIPELRGEISGNDQTFERD